MVSRVYPRVSHPELSNNEETVCTMNSPYFSVRWSRTKYWTMTFTV